MLILKFLGDKDQYSTQQYCTVQYVTVQVRTRTFGRMEGARKG